MDFTRDYTRLAGHWLIVLGVVSLLGLNCGGFLWIWFGNGVKARNKRLWIASIVFLSFSLLIGLGMGAWIAIFGTSGMTLRTFGQIWQDPPRLWGMLFAIAMLIIHAPPLLMMLTAGSRTAIHRYATQNNLSTSCPSCGYDLRHLPTMKCPECGWPDSNTPT